MDDSLKAVLADSRAPVLARVPARVLVLAMEYRRVANSYTTRMKLRKPSQIELSPMAAVNRMLVADKIQNRKDFELHVKGQMSPANARRHKLYFSGWLSRLGVSTADFKASSEELSQVRF